MDSEENKEEKVEEPQIEVVSSSKGNKKRKKFKRHLKRFVKRACVLCMCMAMFFVAGNVYATNNGYDNVIELIKDIADGNVKIDKNSSSNTQNKAKEKKEEQATVDKNEIQKVENTVVNEQKKQNSIQESYAEVENSPIPIEVMSVKKEDLDMISGYTEFVAYEMDSMLNSNPDPDIVSNILIMAEPSAKDFKFIHPIYNDYGKFVSKNVLYSTDKLVSGSPLLVKTIFAGLVPNNGISFIDENGKERYFALNYSGLDGSLKMEEIYLNQ